MIERPFILPTISLILGITAGYYLYIPDFYILFCLIIFLAALLPLNYDKVKNHNPADWEAKGDKPVLRHFHQMTVIFKHRKRLVLPVLWSWFFLFGMLNMNLYLHRPPGPKHIVHYADSKPVVMEGIIAESPEFSPDKVELILAATNIVDNEKSIPAEGRTIITVRGYYPFRYGDLLRLSVNLKTPHNFQNPGRFDYEKYLLYRKIRVRGFVDHPDKIVVMKQNQGRRMRAFIENMRMSIKAILQDNMESPQSDIIQAMILGNRKEISQDITEKFNRTGVAHIIAISGLHVGIIAVVSLFIIRLLMKFSEYLLLKYNMITVSTCLSLIPVIFFCFIAGMGISVIRATIMAVAFMAAILIGRRRDLYNTLAFAAFMILLIAPYSLFDISFQLSFAAVFSILYITPRLSQIISPVWKEEKMTLHPRTSKIVSGSALFVAVSLSATLGTLPLIIFYFNRFSNIVLLANMMVIPLLGILALPISMAFILTAFISPVISTPFIYVSSILVKISLLLVDYFDSLSWSSWIATTPSLMEIAVYYALLFSLFALINRKDDAVKEKKQKHLYLLRAFCVLLVTFFVVHAGYLYIESGQRKYLTMTAIDVGQGNSTLFQLPGGKTLIIDGGGFGDSSFDVGKNVVAPFLLYKRIKKIDYVVLTHPHPDHLGGLIYLLDNFSVREAWTNGQMVMTPMFQAFSNAIRKNNIKWRFLSEQTVTFQIDGVRFDILNPEYPLHRQMNLSDKFQHLNDNSLVIRITFGKYSFLATGDIAGHAEQRIISTGKSLKSDVLIVPHHGGFTSSTMPFLRQIQPRIALISCGKNNIYKDPHPDVLRRLREIKAHIYRTDKNGAITIKTDGVNISLEDYSPNECP